MCPFEILHFAPLGLIAISLYALKSSNNQLLASLSIIALSLAGLIGGTHMHTEHHEAYTMFDPCYGYIVSLAVASIGLVKGLMRKNLTRNKA
jgi:hypothetical protein